MRQQCVDRHRDHAGADRAPERDREIDRVEQQHPDAALAIYAGGPQGTRQTAARGRKLAVRKTAPRIDERRGAGSPLALVAVQEVLDRIAIAVPLGHQPPPPEFAREQPKRASIGTTFVKFNRWPTAAARAILCSLF